jgi:predicted MFS family arabinose efflux permease
VSVLGDFIGAGALLLLAYDRAGQQAVGAAGIFAATAVGSLVVALFGGAVLDRLSRRGGLVGGQLVGALALFAPLTLDGLAPIYGAAVVLGMTRATTAALRQGALADAVPDRLRMGLVAMLGANDQFAQVIGYALGAGFAVAVGPDVALWIDMGSFLVGAALLATAALPGRPASTATPSLTRGWRTIFGHPHLRVLALLVGASALTTALPESMAVVAGGDRSSWVPAIMAAGPAGTGIGFLIGGRLKLSDRFEGQLGHVTFFGGALLLGLLADSAVSWVAINVLIGVGASWVIGPQVAFIRLAPNDRMAQVTATMFAIVMAAEGAGTLILGTVADAAGVNIAYGIAGAVVLAAAAGGWLVRAQRARSDHRATV